MGTNTFQLIELTLDEQRQLQRSIAAIPNVPKDLVDLSATMRFRRASESFEDFLAVAVAIAKKHVKPSD